jgi:hypothetical protein
MPAEAEAEDPDQTISESKPEVILDARQVLGAAPADLDETDEDAPTATVKTRPAKILDGDMAEERAPAPEEVVDLHRLQEEEAEEAPTTVRGDGQAVVMGELDLEGGYEEPDATKPYGPGGAEAYQQRERTKPYGHQDHAAVDVDGQAAFEPEPAIASQTGTPDADPLPSDELPTTIAQPSSRSSPDQVEPPTRIADLRAQVAELVKPDKPPVLGTTSGMHQALEEALDSIDDLFEQVDGHTTGPASQEREVTKPDRPSVKSVTVSPTPSVVGRVKLVKRGGRDNGPLIPPRTLMGIGPAEAEDQPEEGHEEEQEGEFDLELAQTAPLDVVDWGSAGEIQSPVEDEPYASIEIITDEDE